MESNLPEGSGSRRVSKSTVDVGGDKSRRLHKYWHYLFVVSILIMAACVLALLNAYFHLINISSYNASKAGVSSSYVLAGYMGMFLSLAFSPVPDYVLVPVFGYLSFIGLFSPYYTFLVCLVGAVLPVEYVCGRLAARPVLMKVMSIFHVSEKNLETAEKWLVEHGFFSIFISTFIPFWYGAISLAAGTLKMKSPAFLLSSAAGFGLRFVFLEGVGYYTIYIFTASYDYSQRAFLFLLLFLSFAYFVLYLVRTSAQRRRSTDIHRSFVDGGTLPSPKVVTPQ